MSKNESAFKRNLELRRILMFTTRINGLDNYFISPYRLKRMDKLNRTHPSQYAKINSLKRSQNLFEL